MIIFHNGSFTDDMNVIAVNDRGFMLGDGVFDTMLAVNGELVHPQLHFERLMRHAAVLNISLHSPLYPPASGGKESVSVAQKLLQKNGFTEGRYAVRTTITRGSGPRGLALPEKIEPTIVMQAGSASNPDSLPPVIAITTQNVRRNEHSPLSQIKSLNYGDNILALQEARNQNATEAIMLNNAGNAVCASSSNIFVSLAGKIITPPLSDGAMDGVTRSLILQHSQAEEQSITEQDLQTAEALYLSNSITGIRPVTSLDGRALDTDPFPIDGEI